MSKPFTILNHYLVLGCVLMLFNGCKKAEIPPVIVPKSGANLIYSFALKELDNPVLERDVIGTISNDTIKLDIPLPATQDNLIPTIVITGVSVSPETRVVQNFANPVQYTVTAENGDKRIYTVVNTNKHITSFIFRSAKNSVFDADIIGEIGTDTIIVHIPKEVDLTALIPEIAIDGITVDPVSGLARDFTDAVQYTVTASDKSTKTYTVIVSSNLVVFVGSANGFLYALDAINGNLLWKFNSSGGPMGSPTYANGYVYGSNYFSFFALDAHTKAVKWRNTSFNGYFTTPTIVNGTVYVGYHARLPADQNYIYAFDEATGDIQWIHAFGESIGFPIGSVTVSNGLVFICGGLMGLVVVDAATGNIKWWHSEAFMQLKPCVYNGLVYVGAETCTIAAYNIADGTPVWRFFGTNQTSSAIVVKDTLYVGGATIINGNMRALYAMNPADGTLYWTYSNYPPGAFSTPCMYNHTLYAGNGDYRLYAVDAGKGTLNWIYPNSGDNVTASNPVAAGGVVFENRQDNSFYAIDAKRGFVKWRFFANDIINTDPCLVDVSGNSYCPAKQ